MKTKIFLVVFVFILLFSPPILPGIRLMYLLAFFSAIIMMTRYRADVSSVLKHSKLGAVMSLFIFVSGYIALITLASGGFTQAYFLDSIGKMLLTGVCLPICVLYLILVFKRRGYDINEALKIIMYAGLIQVFLALTAFLIPSVKMVFISIMQHNVGTSALFDQFQIESRLFGFAGDMFDKFGYGMSLLSLVPALLAYNTGRIRYLMVVPLFVAATILNSRTGILLLIVVLLPIILLTIKKHALNMRRGRAMLSGLMIAALSVVGGIYGIGGIYETGNDNIKGYTISNYQSIVDYFTGSSNSSEERDNTAELLFSSRFWQPPDSFAQLMFGTGHGKYGIPGVPHSDVGYVNDIWMLGVFGSLVVYVGLTVFILGIRKYGYQYRVLAVGLLLAFLIFQVKGTALWSANFGIATTIMLVAIIGWYCSHDVKDSYMVGVKK